MEAGFSRAFTEELNCSICLSFLIDPVTINCGHSFCRACLQFFWEDNPFLCHCPTCRKRTKRKDFRTNIVLKNFSTNIVLKKLVSIAKQASLMKYLISEENKCVIHKETKGIFCVENRIYLCQLCSDSLMHRGHRHCPIEAAAEGEMNFLVMREDMIRTEYRKWHAVPHEQEDQHIVHMKNEGDCVLEKLRESEATMIQKSKQLREMFQELMAMSQEPYVVLLQDSEYILRRSEAVELSIPQAMKPELSALPITGLTESFNHFKVDIFFEKLFEMHFKKNLFNVMRRAGFKLHHQNTSVDPVGYYLVSWGSQNFISGKYYWELDLNDSSDWAVGVCTYSWLKNRKRYVETKDAFLLFCMKEGSHYSLLTTNPVIHHYIEKPLDKIVLPAECAPVTQTPTNKREHRGSLVKMEPEKDKHVSPEPSKSSASPMDQKKPPVKMVKVKSKRRRHVSKIWRKLSRKHRVVPKDPEDAQVQVGSSIERQHSEGEVSPEPPNSTTSPEYQRKHPSMKVKMKSAKQKFGPKMWRKFYRKCHRIPKDSNEAQVQADTSIAIQRSEVEVLPEPPNSATSPEYQRKHPIRKVKVKSRKCRCGSYAPFKNVASTVDQRKVRAMEVISKKRRFVLAILKEFCEKQATANQDAKMGHMKIEVNALLKRVHRNSMMASKEMPEPNAYNVTTAETTDKKTEELPDHADTTVTPRGPGTMVKDPSQGDDDSPELTCFKGYPEKDIAKERLFSLTSVLGSIAQVGDTDIEDQQNFDSKESFPVALLGNCVYSDMFWGNSGQLDLMMSANQWKADASLVWTNRMCRLQAKVKSHSVYFLPDAIEVQQWELREESSTEHPVINVLFLATPTSSDEDVVIIKRKRKKKRRRYY
ncbi:hypothetical protein ACRRTK_003316 [Alexandromys fortis]